MIDLLKTAYFIAFIILLIAASVTTLARIFAKIYWGIPIPKLLLRDAVLIPGLAIPFLLIFFARLAGPEFVGSLQDNALWIILTSTPAIIGMAVYVYFEIWVIGPPVKSEPAIRERENGNLLSDD